MTQCGRSVSGVRVDVCGMRVEVKGCFFLVFVEPELGGLNRILFEGLWLRVYRVGSGLWVLCVEGLSSPVQQDYERSP